LGEICRAGRSLRARVVHLLRAARLPVAERSTYDEFMLRFHDWLKESSRFQSSAEKTRLSFPPLATWLVFTDGVPHAALSGQFALEQTFIIPPAALVCPDAAPVHILEKLCGRRLA
ncbi:MAG TPA: Kdo hydroxylase family protein, partial [Terriglobales bacterium]